ncbi:hypothetical protein LINPERHAP1_LOCUS30616, partial [Linum perenne]
DSSSFLFLLLSFFYFFPSPFLILLPLLLSSLTLSLFFIPPQLPLPLILPFISSNNFLYPSSSIHLRPNLLSHAAVATSPTRSQATSPATTQKPAAGPL